MKAVLRVGTLALAPLVFVSLAGPIQAQDSCPKASGPNAEAGWAAYADNDMTEARLRFQSAVAQCANDQYARVGLGYVYLRDGRVDEAERVWTVVRTAQPSNVDALVGLGLARWRLGDIDAVRTYFGKVLQLAPGHGTALEYLERVARAEAAAENASADVDAAVDVDATASPSMPEDDPADDAWQQGNTALATQLYQDRLEADPNDGTAILRVALMQAWEERYEPAMRLLDRLIELQPKNLDARMGRARVLAWSGDTQAAQDEVADVLAIEPDNAEALEAHTLFQAWSAPPTEGNVRYDEPLSIAPGSRSARPQPTHNLALAEEFEASEAAFKALLARDPDDIEARLGLARTLAVAQDFDGAIAQYDGVLTRAAGEMRALTGKSRTLGWAGRLVEGERVGLQAVRSDPSSAAAWGSLGEVYRWQGRNAAALEALERAGGLAPTDATIRDQLRSVTMAMAPLAIPKVIYENDSDGNRMVTTSISASWHPMPRLNVSAQAYRKQLDQTLGGGQVELNAQGVTVSGRYQLRPGWTLSGGLGSSGSNGTDNPSNIEYQLGVRMPDRNRLGVSLNLVSTGLNETAALAELGVRSTEISLTGRWVPALGWRVDGTIGLGEFEGTESNARRSAFVAASRRIGRFFSLGASFRGFSFEKDLNDGYFDPDFYGIAEITSYWLYRPAPWTFLVEFAPGVQRVGRDGDIDLSARSNVRVAYQIRPGREISLSFGYSTAGLTSFESFGSGYRYTSFTLGSNWAF